MRLTPILSIALLAFACSPKPETSAGTAAAPAELSAAALDSVKAVDAAFAAGINAKDTAAVLAVYAPDAKVMPPDSPIMEGPNGHAFIVGFMAAGPSEMTLTPNTVYGTGDMAYVVGTATFKMAGNSETVKYAEVIRRGADGKWRYVVDMFSGVAPPAPAAPAKKH